MNKTYLFPSIKTAHRLISYLITIVRSIAMSSVSMPVENKMRVKCKNIGCTFLCNEYDKDDEVHCDTDLK